MLDLKSLATKAATAAAKKEITKIESEDNAPLCHSKNHFKKLIDEINDTLTMEDLQKAIDEAQKQINKIVEKLKDKLSELLPAMRILRVPGANFTKIIGWIKDVIRFIRKLLKPILAIVCELQAISVEIAQLMVAITAAEKRIKVYAQTAENFAASNAGTAMDTSEKYSSIANKYSSMIGSAVTTDFNDPGQGDINSYVNRKTFPINITANTTNINLWDMVDQQTYEPMISDFILTVANNVVLGNNANNGTALIITTWDGDTGFEPGNYLEAANGQSVFIHGDTVKIINNGFIVGDLGQSLSSNTSNTWYYGPAGLALDIEFPIILENNGIIGGALNATYDANTGYVIYPGEAIHGNTNITYSPAGQIRGNIL